MRQLIQAENGTVPPGKMERKLLKQTAREIALILARGWQEEAERLEQARRSWEALLASEPKRNTSLREKMEGTIAELDRAERDAWLYTLLFATTQTPKTRTPFKRRAYQRFLADVKLTDHLVPMAAQEEAWSVESEKRLRKLIKKAFSVRKTKAKSARAD